MTGSKVGRLCWLDFDGEEVSPTGEVIRSATVDFETLFSRPLTDLLLPHQHQRKTRPVQGLDARARSMGRGVQRIFDSGV